MCPDPSLCCSRCLQAAKLVLAQPRITDEQCEAMFKELIDEEACGKDVGYVEPDVEPSSGPPRARMTNQGYENMRYAHLSYVNSMHGGWLDQMTVEEKAAAASTHAAVDDDDKKKPAAAKEKDTTVCRGRKRERERESDDEGNEGGSDEGYGLCEKWSANTNKSRGSEDGRGQGEQRQ